MAEAGQGGHPIRWFRPGEIAFVVQAPRDVDEEGLRSMHQQVRAALEEHVAGRAGGLFDADQRRQQPIVFRSRDQPPLAFMFYDLAQHDSTDAVKQALTELDSGRLDRVRQWGEPLAAMPSWHAAAQQSAFGGGSPGSLPRPVPSRDLPHDGNYRWTYVYQPRDRDLDVAQQLERDGQQAVPVAVLDTLPPREQVQQQAQRFSERNAQLAELAGMIPDREAPPDPDDLDTQPRRRASTEAPPRYSMSDHGLFVGSVIHGIAPRANLRFVPVLSDHGVGELEWFLSGLAELVTNKAPDQPLVINLSLGFSPHTERMPRIWYGLGPTGDRDYEGEPATSVAGQDADWVRRHRAEVRRMSSQLHMGLQQLASYLLEANCLVVAAAGNDSTERVEDGRPRLGPRLPARYQTVLGVAATAARPHQPARYSNMGDSWELGDHVATFGGDVDDNHQPREGVIGAFSAPLFPDPDTGEPSNDVPNQNGWATWSGTSFATAVIAGIAANYWGARRARGHTPRAEDMLYALSSEAGAYVPALRTRSIQVAGEWRRR